MLSCLGISFMGNTICAALLALSLVFACLMGGCGGKPVTVVPAGDSKDLIRPGDHLELHSLIGTASESTATPSARIAGTPNAVMGAWSTTPGRGVWDPLGLGRSDALGLCGAQEPLTVSDGGESAPGLGGTW